MKRSIHIHINLVCMYFLGTFTYRWHRAQHTQYTSFACLCIFAETLSSDQCNNRNSDFMFRLNANKINKNISLDFRRKIANQNESNEIVVAINTPYRIVYSRWSKNDFKLYNTHVKHHASFSVVLKMDFSMISLILFYYVIWYTYNSSVVSFSWNDVNCCDETYTLRKTEKNIYGKTNTVAHTHTQKSKDYHDVAIWSFTEWTRRMLVGWLSNSDDTCIF